MKKTSTNLLTGLFITIFVALVFNACKNTGEYEFEADENEEYDGPDKAIEFEIERTKDLSTGKVPWDQLLLAIQQTKQAKDLSANSNLIEALSWIERGPDSDITGPSNGNTRANGGVTAGRIRGVMVDSLDPTKKTVWVGGVDGGLWKTTDITTSPANWILVNDYLSNLAVSAICQDPRPAFYNTMYFCTGESYSNADAVLGVGVFKSTDGGATWNFLPSTSNYTSCTRILCDYQGNVYLATRNNGLLRSTDGGNTWANITPSGVSNNICDLEISSTSGPGRLHMVAGIFSTQTYRYTDIPATVTTATGWNAPTTPFPTYSQRAEIAVSGNVLYSLPCNASYQVPTIFKSTDGGDNWIATTGQPAANWASGQGWYSLSVGINPVNPDECIVGGLDCHKTTNGGASWTKISAWVGTAGQYVHADQHNVQWWDGGNKLLFACDGGVHFSSDGGTTIRDRNIGLRLKQFYSIAVHPTTTDYFLAGAQDNGTHQLTNPGLGSSVEVTGGDGGYVAIDQDQPQYQFGSYVYNTYRRSTNGGSSWSSINFYAGTSASPSNIGRFINPYDLDNSANIIYAAINGGNYFRWTNPQTQASGSYYQSSPGWPATATAVAIPQFNGGTVSAIHASPFIANRVYFGTGSGRIVRVDNADGASPVDVNITGASMPAGYVNCVNTGSSDQYLIACFTNYGVVNVWVSNDGGISWTGIDGNLPNMPVRWAMFHPDDNNKAIIATETGIWETDLINGGSTVWSPNTSFPTVRTDMIKYRPSDRTIAAGTHGRGVWTTTVPLPIGFSFNNPAPVTSSCPAGTSMALTLNVISNGGFTNPVTLSASGNPPGTTVSFSTNPVTPGAGSGTPVTVTLNGTQTLTPGNYSVTVLGVATGVPDQTRILTYIINPGVGPTITSQPASQTMCSGAPVSLCVTATGTIYSYQWQAAPSCGGPWSNLAGAISSCYNTTATGNFVYRCIITGPCGTTTSDCAVLTVNSAPAISTQPQDVTLCAGSNYTFSVTAAGSNINYQWQEDAGGGFVNINNGGIYSGANSSSLTLSGITAGMNNYKYRCVVTGICSPQATSNSATLIVVTPASVSGHPNNSTICDGGNTSFSVTGVGSGIIYQWQVNTGSGFVNLSNGGVYSGVNSATLNITGANTSMNGYQYRVLLSNSTCTSPATSNTAILTVNALPSISSQPSAATICVGSNNTFSVTAAGSNISYQWQLSTDGGANFNNISNGGVYSGATSSSLLITGATASLTGYLYRCVVSGTCTPASTSNSASLIVIVPPSISLQPTNKEICSGDNSSFSVTGIGSTQPIIYQWQMNSGSGFVNVNNGGVYSGATTATLTITNAPASMSGYQYRALLSNATCSSPATSGNATLTVRQLPSVTLSASPLNSLQPGQTTSLTATPSGSTGGALTTTWLFNNNVIANNGNTRVINVEQIGSYQVTIQEAWPGSLVCSNLSQIVTIDAPASPKLFIFPSPNDGRFTVSYYNPSSASVSRTITIYDSRGSLIFNRKFTISGSYTLIPIDLRPANGGVYYVIIGDQNGKKIIDGKLLVQ